MSGDWASWLGRWSEAGLLDAQTADRIRAYEQQHAGSGKLRGPVTVALAFGALMISGGILLFVAAHWDTLSPAQRFAIVLLPIAAFHLGGGFVGERYPGMSSALHAIGTVSLGAGIALAGQIFHLAEHWPSGVMMWALGAAAGWFFLRQIPQFTLLAVLAPAWLVSEWLAATYDRFDYTTMRVISSGTVLLALAYVSAAGPGRPSRTRQALVWLGSIALLVSLPLLSYTAAADPRWFESRGLPLSTLVVATAWTVALAGPTLVAFALRRGDAWPNVVAVGWVLILFGIRSITGSAALYGWWALGAIGLVGWGVRDGRTERVNIGAVIFAATVVAFYFSEVMDKLGRSASLVGLGVLFLAGGWALERLRRRLVEQARGAA